MKQIAKVLGWPVGRVLIATGAYQQEDFELVLNAAHEVNAALAELDLSAYASLLGTPLSTAAADHQRLIAALYTQLRLGSLLAPFPASR